MYCVAGAPVGIYRPAADDLGRHDPKGTLVEFPGRGERVELPFGLFRLSLDRILEHRPFSLSLHAREAHPQTHRLPLDGVDSFITYVNLHTVVGKMESLFRRYNWATMREILEKEGHLQSIREK